MRIEEIIDERDMTENLDAAIRGLLSAAFPNDVAVFSRTRAWHESQPAYTAIIREDGRITAHIGIVDRTVTLGGTPLRAAGVQNVVVPPEFQGKGLSGAAMRLAMEEAAKRGFDIGLLFCLPVLEKVYAPQGWLTLEGRDVTRIDGGAEKPLPAKNIAMYYPLREGGLPDGDLHIGGNDW